MQASALYYERTATPLLPPGGRLAIRARDAASRHSWPELVTADDEATRHGNDIEREDWHPRDVVAEVHTRQRRRDRASRGEAGRHRRGSW